MRWQGKALISTILIVAGAILAFVGYAELLIRPEFGLSHAEVWRESVLLTFGMLAWPFWGPPLGLLRIHEIPWPLHLARILVPLGIFSGAGLLLARLFGAKLRAFGAQFARDHIVVCAGGPAAWQFVADLQRSPGGKVVVLDLERARPDAGEGRFVPVLPAASGIHDDLLLRAALPSARAIVAFGDDDMRNVEIMLRAKSLSARRRSPGAPPLIARAAMSAGAAEEAAAALFGAPDRSFAFSPISVARNTVRLLLREHPLDRDPLVRAGARPHVRIIGFEGVGQELALEVARSGHFAAPGLPLITIVDPDASRLFARMAEGRPELAETAEFHLMAADIETVSAWNGEPGDRVPISRTVVCLADEIAGLRVAAALNHPRGESGTAVSPVFVRLARAPVAAEALRAASAQGTGAAILPFGDAASLFTRDIVLGETLDTLAREVHAYYRENRAARDRIGDAIMLADRPWDDLPEGFREASRHQADHMLAKLRMVGCDAVPQPATPAFAFSPDEIEFLSQVEHRRWNAERRVAGWRFAAARRDDALEHPSLVSWEELSESEREKDREAVRAIPKILARAGLFVRREPGAE